MEKDITLIWDQFLKSQKPSPKEYLIVCPPPNVTGSLHLGHCVTFSYIDVYSRYKILNGYNVKIIGGTDHASNATTIMVRKNYKDVNDDNFQEKAKEWILKAQENIIKQIKDLGVLMDWDKFCYTLDDQRSKGVIHGFNIIYNKGLIFKDKKMVNWDTHFGTAISDLEVDIKEKDGMMYYIDYKFEDGDEFITIATTRPETIMADMAIAINPTDENKIHLIGKNVIIPWINRKIPIITSDAVDKDFGTGFLKITPGHSFDDYNIWLKNDAIKSLTPIDLLDNFGKFIGPHCPLEIIGMNVKEGRKWIVNFLELKGKPIKQNIPYSDRSETIVEGKITEQWFFDVTKFKEEAIYLVQNKLIKFWPDSLINNYKSWLNNLQLWCISRDLPLGHRIPIWYDDYGNKFCGHDYEEAYNKAINLWQKSSLNPTNLIQDKHTLDTWFSSGMFHKTSLGWPEENNKCDLIVTGHDILFFWITRMILMSLGLNEENHEIAFNNVLFHGLVRDKQGNKMSKTRGNTIDPYIIAKDFSFDNVRLTLMMASIGSNDLKIGNEHFEQTNKIITKFKNAWIYCQSFYKPIKNVPITNNKVLKSMINITDKFIKEYKYLMDNYESNKGVKLIIHDFFYKTFCDEFIEFHKVFKRLNEFNENETNEVMAWIFQQLLLLLHPYLPHLTENIWLEFHNESILINSFQDNYEKNHEDNEFYGALEIISILRYFRQVFQFSTIEIVNINDSIYNNIIKETFYKTVNPIEILTHSLKYNDLYGGQWMVKTNGDPRVLKRFFNIDQTFMGINLKDINIINFIDDNRDLFETIHDYWHEIIKNNDFFIKESISSKNIKYEKFLNYFNFSNEKNEKQEFLSQYNIIGNINYHQLEQLSQYFNKNIILNNLSPVDFIKKNISFNIKHFIIKNHIIFDCYGSYDGNKKIIINSWNPYGKNTGYPLTDIEYSNLINHYKIFDNESEIIIVGLEFNQQ